MRPCDPTSEMHISTNGYHYPEMESRAVPKARTERDLVEAVQVYLRNAGYKIADSVRIRTWSPDIVAVKGNELVIVEVKGERGELRKTLARTALYATDASAAYLAVPRTRITPGLKDAARILGVGLMEMDDGVEVVVKAALSTARPSLLGRVRKSIDHPRTPPPEHVRPSRIPFDKILRHRSILEALLAHPGRKFTIRELSAAARTSYATTWRIVEALRALGAISSERVGPSEHLALKSDSPLASDLRQLSSLELAPHRLAAREFARKASGLPGVERIILFGSVARGREEPGSDVDVAVVVRRKTESLRNRLYETVSEVQDLTRMNVVPLLVTPHELGSKGQLGEALRTGEVLYEGA